MAERSATIDGLYSPDVVVASVQSLCRPNRLARFPADYFGLVVIDEAHHATATTYRKIVDHFLGSVLDESGIVRIDYEESTHVLGVTATPDRRDCRALGDLFAASAFVYELREAIAAGRRRLEPGATRRANQAGIASGSRQGCRAGGHPQDAGVSAERRHGARLRRLSARGRNERGGAGWIRAGGAAAIRRRVVPAR